MLQSCSRRSLFANPVVTMPLCRRIHVFCCEWPDGHTCSRPMHPDVAYICRVPHFAYAPLSRAEQCMAYAGGCIVRPRTCVCLLLFSVFIPHLRLSPVRPLMAMLPKSHTEQPLQALGWLMQHDLRRQWRVHWHEGLHHFGGGGGLQPDSGRRPQCQKGRHRSCAYHHASGRSPSLSTLWVNLSLEVNGIFACFIIMFVSSGGQRLKT